MEFSLLMNGVLNNGVKNGVMPRANYPPTFNSAVIVFKNQHVKICCAVSLELYFMKQIF